MGGRFLCYHSCIYDAYIKYYQVIFFQKKISFKNYQVIFFLPFSKERLLRVIPVRSAWTGTWNPPLPQALSDQRLAEFLRLQSHVVDLRPLEATRDAWVWRHSRFTVKAVYRLLCGQLPLENVYVRQRCRLIWKRHIPLKIRIFGWLLLRRRLMTRVARQRMFPDSPVSCPLCGGA